MLKTPTLAADFADKRPLWEEIKRLAEIHRLAGALAYGSSQWLPEDERPWRDQVLMAHHAQHARRLAALRKLVEAFRDAGLTCVSMKGPLLAERFYAVPFLRPANDLDLLIRLKDVGAAAILMKDLGYRLEGSYPWGLQYRLTYHLNFASTGDSPRVELHYDLRASGLSLDSEAMIDRSLPWMSPTGFESNVLDPADEAFYCCIHAATHAFHRLRWLLDVVTMARKLSATERSRVRELAVHHRQTGLFVAASLATKEFLNESLEFDNTGFGTPWLWSGLRSHHLRNMVERVDGNTVTLAEKIGYRMDFCRMAGTPLRAARLLAYWTGDEFLKGWYRLLHRPDPEILSRTLPE